MIWRHVFLGINGALFLVWIGLIAMPVRMPDVGQKSQPAPDVPGGGLTAGSPINLSRSPTRSLFRPVPLSPAPVLPPVFVSVKPTSPAPPPEKALRLVGLVDHTEGKVAFIEAQGIRDIQRRLVGEVIEGWVIADIGRRDITLHRDGENRTLLLDPAQVR